MQQQQIAGAVVNRKMELRQANRNPKLITIRKAADMLGCAVSTLRAWDNKGIFPAVRIGERKDRRYFLHDIEAMIQEKELHG